MKQLNNVISTFSVVGEDDYSPEKQELKTLANLISRFAPHDGRFELPVPDVHLVRGSQMQKESVHTMSSPGICIVAQGAKLVSLAQESWQYDPSNMVVYAAEVPVRVRFTKASQEEPYLCMVVHIDPKKLTDLIFKVFPQGLKKNPDSRAIYVGNSNPRIVKSAIRIIELILQGEDVDLLVPLVVEEILIRLLRSPAGPAIAQIGLTDSNTHKISRAISWLKENYMDAMKIDDLAKIANMSPSSFHSHFKTITAMSPLQFQKNLRLQESRNLLIAGKLDVSSASHQVGYSSVSQFSREYSRLFGSSPSKDVGRYRAGQ